MKRKRKTVKTKPYWCIVYLYNGFNYKGVFLTDPVMAAKKPENQFTETSMKSGSYELCREWFDDYNEARLLAGEMKKYLLRKR